MKLYRTSGAGAAQQTLDVNDEKIKIYADDAALDADLANIGENEIVATNEEDSQREGTQYPVDIVQDGNMNAVTSNAVADTLSAKQQISLYGVNTGSTVTITPSTSYTPLTATTNITITKAKKYTIIAPVFYKVTNTPGVSYQLQLSIKIDDDTYVGFSASVIYGFISATLMANVDLSEGQHSISIGARVDSSSKVVNIEVPYYNVAYVNII